MRKAPLNYLITIAAGALLWVITAIFIGASYSEALIFAESTPEEFNQTLWITFGIAAFSGIMACVFWFYYGSKDSTAGVLQKAKKVWWIWFAVQIIISILLLIFQIISFLSEGLLPVDWIIVWLLISLHTYIFFWFFTFSFSPRTVKFIPLFK